VCLGKNRFMKAQTTVKVPLTAGELGLINGMAAIATAACWGEGHYATWGDEDTYASFASLRGKIHAALCEARDADSSRARRK
jgi:hypothetical protein